MWVACLRAQSCGVLLYYFSRLSFHRPVNCDGARPTRAFLPRAGACWRSGSAGARCQVHLLLCNTRCANPSACCWLWRGLPAAAGGHLSPRLRRGCFPVRRGWFPSLPSTCGGFDHLVLRSACTLFSPAGLRPGRAHGLLGGLSPPASACALPGGPVGIFMYGCFCGNLGRTVSADVKFFRDCFRRRCMVETGQVNISVIGERCAPGISPAQH
jgi:hypothetical protein